MTPLLRKLIIPDVHIPFEDKRAWRLMMKVAKKFKPQGIWVLGDFVDCGAISRHLKSPDRAAHFKDELLAANLRLDELDALGASEKEFIEGNHEDRLPRFLFEHAPALHGVVSIEGLLQLKQRGWNQTRYKRHIKRGKLYITHDVGVAGRYAAYRALETFQHSVISAHNHRMCMVVEGNAVGEAKVSATFGWLGDRSQIDYMQLVKVMKDTALGFGIGYLNPKTGYMYLVPVPIVGYSCVVEGELYAS